MQPIELCSVEILKVHLKSELGVYTVCYAVNICMVEKSAVEKISIFKGNTFEVSYLVIVHEVGIIPLSGPPENHRPLGQSLLVSTSCGQS